ncbi:xylulokinase [Streptomyces sp. H10-C2]|uniref:xylulokinase n=1 Tax=unclassified Streptomyces TaxID=2593676 RepID=UPI0024B91328|nr:MULTISPECIES: xylulokinase [unclassified Streptomyces]MDJ0346634.1 xylulokinase [Streptomyces sp. PH10-H1]MDJ0374993.1 xylulokinase [Streptomyces sp. H10-C2]
MEVVIGVDSSTQSTKALAVRVDTGEVLARARAPHTVSEGKARESNPETWWQALQKTLTHLSEHTAQAISIAGQQHGLVTLDETGRPLRPALLWNDVRSAPQAEELVKRFGTQHWADRFGSVPGPSFTAAKWAWLRANEPATTAATAAVRLPHDFLTERLTGEAVTDRGDVSGTGWWASDTETYDEAVLTAIGLDPALLPRVLPPGEPAGATLPGLSLPPGILVASGTGDNAAAALGLGLTPGRAAVSLGTSGTVYTPSTSRPTDPTGTIAGFAGAHGGWLPLACTLNCTQAVDRIAALLNLDRETVAPPGETVFLPYLDGERTPNLPHASGTLSGLRHDTTAGQVLQAAYDGAAFTLLAALDLVLAVDGAPSDEPLLLIGGGARGTAWRQTIRRLSGRAVQVPDADDLVALGAATQAAALLTGEHPTAIAARWGTTAGPVYDPIKRDEATLKNLAAALTTI